MNSKINLFKNAAFAFVVCLPIFCGLHAHAQNPKNYYVEDPKTFVGGLTAGVNFTQVDGDSYKGYRNLGINAGVTAYTFFLPQVAGGLELLFVQKGAKSNGSQISNGGQTIILKQNITLNYAEIPVMLHFFDKKRNHASVGFSYARLINSKEEIVGNNKSVVYNPDLYPFKKSDYNFIVGGNVHLYKGFFAGVRFQYSLLSVRSKTDPEFASPQQFNNVFSLRLSYLFF